ncbi:MAG: dTDP-4-dehydrorhamnose reductase [Rikenella sp.]|nr:dTDP-4-dehydrorhamnose reductase [Rikenella sp.]
MDKIVVTGANGQLGNELRAIEQAGLYGGRYEFVFTDVAELDITDREAVLRFVEAERPQWIINAAAYTAVDRAESDSEKALLLNATAVRNLVKAAEAVGAGFVQVSTDYVFDGRMPADRHALTEEEPVGPQSVYGRTKLRGEEYALAYPKSLVVRTAWLYSAYGNNFVKTMLRLGAERSELNVVADQWGTPTYAADLAAALMRMVSVCDAHPERTGELFGLYHYTNDGITTWCEFAQEIMRLGERSCVVRPIASSEYPAAASRPAWSVLSKRKISDAFDVELPDWRDSLARCIRVL